MKPVGIGIVGCGNISEAYLIGAAASSLVVVRGVADIRPEVAAAKASAHGVPAKSVEQVLEDPDIAIVVNLTVPLAHAEVSHSILDAGKHVYSEKPLAATFAEAAGILEHAERSGLRVGCAPDTFFGAPHQAARHLIDSGRLGKVFGGGASFMTRGMEDWHPAPDFLFKTGAGPVLDNGPYLVTQLVNLLGPVEDVVALGSSPRKRRMITSEARRGEYIDVEVDTTVNAVLGFGSGANIVMSSSWDVLDHRRSAIEVFGEKGTLVGATPNWFDGEVITTDGSGEWEDVDSSVYAFGEINRNPRPGVVVGDYRSVGIIDMAAAIAGDRPHRASGALALHVLEVLEGIGRSIDTGARVIMSTDCERPEPLPPGQGEEVFLHG